MNGPNGENKVRFKKGYWYFFGTQLLAHICWDNKELCLTYELEGIKYWSVY